MEIFYCPDCGCDLLWNIVLGGFAIAVGLVLVDLFIDLCIYGAKALYRYIKQKFMK